MLTSRRSAFPPWLALIVIALVAGAVGGAFAAFVYGRQHFAAAEAVLSRPRRTVAQGVDGPGTYAGFLDGGDAPSPTGAPASVWGAWVTVTTGSGKNRSTRTVCRIASAWGATLDDGTGTLTLQFPPHSLRITASDGSNADDPTAQMFLARRDDSRPFVTVSGAGCIAAGYGSTRYYETRAPPGSQLTVSACRRGNVLGPCGDRADYLSITGPSTAAHAWVGHAMIPIRVAASILGALLAIFGAVAVYFHVRADRDAVPALRTTPPPKFGAP